ncbi:MAG TPA: hypothetical protein VGL02_30340 [Streptomyces sp.]
MTAAEDRWSLAVAPVGRAAAVVVLGAETAWRLCTRGVEPTSALAHAHVEGQRPLAEANCQIVSVVR